MTNKVYIFDSHPVQYKAPVYQEMHRLAPGLFEVLYATDASVRSGNIDKEFGIEVKWDTPLLNGYEFRVLGNERDTPFSGPSTLTGRGIYTLLKKERPQAVLLTQARYHFDHAAYLSARLLNIPILIRQETQDEMYASGRSWLKSKIRSSIYRRLYAPVRHAFCFGELNRQHLIRHGFSPERMSIAHFSVRDPLKDTARDEKLAMRLALRAALAISNDATVVSFFGKLIPKKNPDLIFEALNDVSDNARSNLHLLFVGAGELEPQLKSLAKSANEKWGISSTFAGFINQQKLPEYYLTSDIVALPSRRMGEAWGLVINEALNAGCAVIMSDAVGCHHEFGTWERARVIPEGNSTALAQAISELSKFPRELDWARDLMESYSTEAAAADLVRIFQKYVSN